ncbi:MAG: amidase domain-containing protein [Clostridia bacterium]|nr:amidase domain-containing protein [Clostridia bacterium]
MLVTKPYQRERAVEYAKKWALSQNPLFADFSEIGGNCTNFASQCVLAGSCVMNYTPDFGWYYVSLEDRAPAWTGVDYFYDFMTMTPSFASRNGGVGPFASLVSAEAAELGDVVQLRNASGAWYHSLVITGKEGEEILVSAQTNDVIDRPLSSYNYADARFLHIEGVRIEVNDDQCYQILLAGGADPTQPQN